MSDPLSLSPGLDLPHRNKSEMHVRLNSLKFDNANNAALSLDCIAEWVRIGKLKISIEDRADGLLRIAVSAP